MGQAEVLTGQLEVVPRLVVAHHGRVPLDDLDSQVVQRELVG